MFAPTRTSSTITLGQGRYCDKFRINAYLWLQLIVLFHIGTSQSGTTSTPIFDDFYFSTQPSDIIVENGRPALLNCLAKHISVEPSIRWIREKEYLNFGADSRRHLLANGSLYFEEVIHTRSARPDEGIYQCVATVEGLGSIVSRSAKVQVAYLRPFASEPRNLILHLNDIAMFACDVDGLPNPEVTWFKNDRPLVEAENINMRIHQGGALEISPIQFSDFGNYKCQAQNAAGQRTSEIASLTQNPVLPAVGSNNNPIFVMEPTDTTAIAMESVMLYCGANGRGQDGVPPTITWLKDGVTIDMLNLDTRFRIVGQGSLSVRNVEYDDTGVYTCRAANLDESVDAQAKLQVHVPPKFISGPTNTAANTNEDVEFKCDVTGFPKPTITWVKNGDLIIPNDYFQIVDGHDLRILGLVDTDKGLYQCVVNNEAGNIQAIAQLKILLPGQAQVKVTDLPSAPQRLRSVMTSTRFVTLAWDVPSFTGPSEIISYSVYWKESGSNRERLMNTSNQEVNIQHLKPAATYDFRVLAYNRFGPGKDFALLNLTTKPEVDVPSAVLNVQVHVLSPTSISVTWQPPVETHGDITVYTVFYYEPLARQETEKEVTSTACILTDLNIYTDYHIRIVAFNANGRGMSTDEFTARTLSAIPSDTPQNVTLEPVSSSSIIIRWEPPPDEHANGIITGYKLRYKKAAQRDEPHSSKTITTDGNIRFYALTDLDRATRYQFRIAAMNVNGTGPATKWMTVHTFISDLDETKVPGQPSSLRVRPYSTAIVVSWTPPIDQDIKVRGYTLGYGINIPDIYSQVLDSKRRLYTIESLKPSSEYVISLRAFNKVGDGRPVYETVITREESAPEPATPMIPPVGLRAIVLSPMTVLVRWTDTTLGRNQHINDNRFYTVRYAPKNTRKYRNVNTTDLNAHINDLRPNTEYEFAVKVVKGKRKSAWSMNVLNTTLEAAPFSAPRDLTPVQVEELPFGISLNWQPPKLPNGQITDVTGYLVFYTEDPSLNDRNWAVEGVLGDRLSITLRELKPSTKYYFKIQARNSKGYGPMSSSVTYTTPAAESKSPNILWIVLACLAGFTLVAILTILAVYFKRRRNPQNNANRGYKASSKGGNFTPNEVKPPDLWIHHDQMELKNISQSPDTTMTVTPIPQDLKSGDELSELQRNSFITDSSFERRSSHAEVRARLEEEANRYRRPLRSKPISFPVDSLGHRDPLATATGIIPNGHLVDLAAPIPIRPVYPRTQYNTQYGSTGTRIPPMSDISSQPGSDYMTDDQSSTYDGRSLKRHRSRESLKSRETGPQSPDSTYNSAPIPYDQLSNASSSGASTPLPDPNFCKSLPHQRSGHPLKSFTMPAPPSVPGTPTSKHIVKPLISASPYKKTTSSSPSPTNSSGTPLKSRSPLPVISPRSPPDVAVKSGKEDEIGLSCSTEELSAEMANLEGIMKDLTAITASKEFHC